MSTVGVIARAQRTATPAIVSAATALASQPGRLGWSIRNMGQNPLFVRLGASGSTSVFDLVLAAGTANDNGTGGAYSERDGVVYSGIVTIAGTSPRYVVSEYYET